LNEIEEQSLVAFDYETTGLKPQADGHRIICASVAISAHIVYVFMMPSTRAERKPFINLLANPKIRKMAHNMKFEETWSVVRLRQSVQSWEWDSMITAHILDNRPGINSLKFQAYVNFGVVDYSSDITPYLQSPGKSGNEPNTIDQLIKTKDGQDMLLKYCALDSIYEYRLAMLQKELVMNTLPF
jgi:DNA polymerase I-like protein with 3'-5' exonuclease and polymerase domains